MSNSTFYDNNQINLAFLNTLEQEDLEYVKQIINNDQIMYTMEENFKTIINRILISKSMEENIIEKNECQFHMLVNNAGVSNKLRKAVSYGLMPQDYIIKNKVRYNIYISCINGPFCKNKTCPRRHRLPSKQLCKNRVGCKMKYCVFVHNCYKKENCDKSCNFTHINCKYGT